MCECLSHLFKRKRLKIKEFIMIMRLCAYARKKMKIKRTFRLKVLKIHGDQKWKRRKPNRPKSRQIRNFKKRNKKKKPKMPTNFRTIEDHIGKRKRTKICCLNTFSVCSRLFSFAFVSITNKTHSTASMSV